MTEDAVKSVRWVRVSLWGAGWLAGLWIGGTIVFASLWLAVFAVACSTFALWRAMRAARERR